MNKIFVTDWILVLLFIGTAVTGIGLHLADEIGEHEVWHNWAVAHVIFGLAMLWFIIRHAAQHKFWYKNLFRKRAGGKPKIITILLNLDYMVLALTGLILLPIESVGLGRWHWILGLAGIALALFHILPRVKILKKSLNKKGSAK